MNQKKLWENHYSQWQRNGFTLVELVVVVTIIAILWTVWFVSYSNYVTWSRDANRIAQATRVWDALVQYQTQDRLPLPENNVRLINWFNWSWEENIFWYQGSLWQTVLQTIDFSNEVRDPRDGSAFTYLVSVSRNNFQILTHLEDARNTRQSTSQVGAQLQNRHIRVFWARLWVIVNADTLLPIERLNMTVFNLNETSTERFRAYVSDNEFVEWAPTELARLDEVMRDRGRGWRIENNSFTCHDPEWVFPCSSASWSLVGGGWSGPTPSPDPDPTPAPWPTPWTPGADDPALLFSFNPTNNSLSLSSSPSSSQFNTFQKETWHWWFNVTLEIWDNNNTINLSQWNDTIVGWFWNNLITTTNTWNRTITLWDWFNSIELGSWNHNINLWSGDNTIVTTNWWDHQITVWNGNNTLNLTGMNNGIIQLWNGTNVVSVTWSPNIRTWTSWNATINFWNQTWRTTNWNGWNLTINWFHRWGWWDRINVSNISSLNNCNDVRGRMEFSNNNQRLIIPTSQWTLELNWSWSENNYDNCSRINNNFQF